MANTSLQNVLDISHMYIYIYILYIYIIYIYIHAYVRSTTTLHHPEASDDSGRDGNDDYVPCAHGLNFLHLCKLTDCDILS